MRNHLNEPIAVVGSACRFAGDATSPSKLWDVLQKPIDLQQKIHPSRFNPDGFYHPEGSYHGHSNVRHAYLLNQNLATFDAEFFGIKPVEAKAMDPQQRFLLEVVYEALESGGMAMGKLRGSDTGVYVGVMFNDYAAMLLRDHQEMPTYYATGTGQSILSNRISHFFDWHGPSISLDTACSSSLVAVHMAVQALRSGDSRMALACGTNLIIGPEGFIIESKLNMLSPDGRSRMWDREANGYARGDGVAAVVLKTLTAAREDGDDIECIIRETCLNQDGATPGITMPKASAQEALIRSTYARAGLNILVQRDRPQFFEAHGTGTSVGDPTEAEAVYKAFFTSPSGDLLSEPLTLGGGHPLYVGSIKTLIGHTEGSAGMALLVKVSLALQHSVIPPNLHFNQLSDRVEPFYKSIEILRTAKPWPSVKGQTRRASVNSFGFGGANAHAIIESFENVTNGASSSNPIFTPFVFSAFSEYSLRQTLSAYATFLDEALQNGTELNLQDLAWTLRQRRSVLPHRIAFTSSSLADLRSKIVTRLKESGSSNVGIKTISSRLSDGGRGQRVLGIFTGQGAQYARMGAELLQESATARRIIGELDSYLAQIPTVADRPSWSLEAELLNDEASTRVHEAAISQPLCTALQLLLVDLLKLSGLRFSAVVGHSSGEIAAAYAAGCLSARHAMWIAYYRSFHSSLAASPNGPKLKGAMIAVGSTLDDISELCDDDIFAGRITVAASNSSSSVTVSGDADAIAELELILDDENKFHRRLKVDRAYHSSHMLPCLTAYKRSLRSLGIELQEPSKRLGTWYSSLRDGRPVDAGMAQQLLCTYWLDNLTKSVLFSRAVSNALEDSSYDVALEIGPHPALAAPTKQVMQDTLGKELRYHGLLSRNLSAVESFSTALGLLWSSLDGESIDLDICERALSGVEAEYRFSLVKALPRYRWNHNMEYWHEARSSRKTRLRSHPVHPLLGDVTSDSAQHHMIWRNLLRISEMEWLSGHAVQGQIVFPAAGYLTSAIEASHFISAGTGSDIRLIEIHDFLINQAIAFEHETSGIEVLIELSDITREQQDVEGVIRARFTYSAALDGTSNDLVLVATGNVIIHMGKASSTLLPARGSLTTHMIDVETENFYSALADLGYNFRNPFRALSAIQRKRGKASCSVELKSFGNEDGLFPPLLVHPAELDAVLQSAIAAYSYPYDEELRTLHLPTSVHLLRINPVALRTGTDDKGTRSESMTIDASLDVSGDALKRKVGDGIVADISVYTSSSSARSHAAIQIHGAAFKPLGGSVTEEDRQVYIKEYWIPDQLDLESVRGSWEDPSLPHLVALLERVSVFYLRKFHREIHSEHPARTTFPTKWYLNFARHVTEIVADGKHKWWNNEWENDSIEKLLEASQPYMHLPSMEIVHLVGKQMPRVFSGETTMLEEFRTGGSDILDRNYAEGIGTKELGHWIGRIVKQLTDRYPSMEILEVGAGTGGATKATFHEINDTFVSYTYTDVSSEFFESASSMFSQYGSKMIYKTFDLERDPLEQGFVEGKYDLVIAFFAIHATEDLERSLRNIRKVLKPGGYLVMGEGSETESGAATHSFIFGTLPGWWVGTNKGRILSPLVNSNAWDQLLRKSGFSGMDTAPSAAVEEFLDFFPIVSQAVDDYVNFLREPLSAVFSLDKAGVPSLKRLTLIGGQTSRTLNLIERLKLIFEQGFAQEIQCFKGLNEICSQSAETNSAIISLTELDSHIFQDITPEDFEALKQLFEPNKTLLWVTSGRLSNAPFANMTNAFGRVASHETPDLHLQQLEIPNPEMISPEIIAATFLRMYAAFSRKNQNTLSAIEPELVIDGNGRQLVPRLNFITELNQRYNAGRRPVVRDIDLEDSSAPIALVCDEGENYLLKELSCYAVNRPEVCGSDRLLELRVTHTILSALKISSDYRFLVLGVLSGTESFYLALVPAPVSILKVPSTCAIQIDLTGTSNEGMLQRVAAHLVSATILEPLREGQVLVVHNSPYAIAKSLNMQSIGLGVRLIYTVDKDDGQIPSSWIKLPQYLNRSALSEILALPDSSAAFVGLSDRKIEKSENEEVLALNVGSLFNTVMRADSVFSLSGTVSNNDPDPAEIQNRLCNALAHAQQQSHMDTNVCSLLLPPTERTRLENLVHGLQRLSPLCVVNWVENPLLPVHVARLDANPIFKRNSSTYWIVGMSGALGISLADWMISNGARNLVMSSRKPDISPEWIAAHKLKGAHVLLIACDVTEEVALQAACRKICDIMPPIVGVIHGAMVLRDQSIRDMSFDQLTDVIRPKVDGSIFLDRIFRNINLDFFVLVSSINSVLGNVGQANYAAANAFMCSLAAQRRKRGLRAAVVNGGAIIGAGYMERENRRAWDRITQNAYMMRLSEEDFVQSVCEAIHASQLDSPHGPEISTGLNCVPADALNPPFWSSHPKFSNFIRHQRVMSNVNSQGKAATISEPALLEKLRDCESRDEVYNIIKHSFAATLRAILMLKTSDDDLMASRSTDIGLDSLVSVSIRSWFLKHLQIGIPVLKIMAHDTMANLIQFAISNMPIELTPRLQTSTSIDNRTDIGHYHVPDNGLSSLSPISAKLSPMTTVGPKTSPNAPDAFQSNGILHTRIDWEAESSPPVDLLNIKRSKDLPPPTKPPDVVVLTGVTGLFGGHLLSYLLTHTSIRKIICVAIRNLSLRLANHALPPQGPRVEYHAGDLSAPLLGLSLDQAASIFSAADAVIHNGADTSHMKSYPSLRAANVDSTVTLARLCLPRLVPLHYVSSAGIAILAGPGAIFPPICIASIAGSTLPAADGSFGYVGAKWACERLLERTHLAYAGSWDVSIHRPSTIIREGEDAVDDKVERDWVNALLLYARKLGAVPRVRHNRGTLDLVHVENACRDLVAQVVRADEREKWEVGYRHEVGDVVIPLDRLSDAVSSFRKMEEPKDKTENGGTFEVLPMGEWIQRAMARGLHPGVAALVELLDAEELHRAARKGYKAIVIELLKKGAKADILNRPKSSPLYEAILNSMVPSSQKWLDKNEEQTEIAKRLIKHDSGKLTTRKNRTGDIPLHSAARVGNTALFRETYEQNPRLILQKNQQRRYDTALHVAAYEDCLGIVTYIVIRLNNNPTLKTRKGQNPAGDGK